MAIAAGYFHFLALKNDGTVVAWGDNEHGEVTGTPAGPPYTGIASPVTFESQVLHGVTAISGGALSSAAIVTLEASTPRLSVTHSGASVIVSWPRSAESFVLDQSSVLASLPSTNLWSAVSTATYQSNVTRIFISVPTATSNTFYRLRKA